MAKNMMKDFVKDDDVEAVSSLRMSYDYIVDYVVETKEWMYTPPNCLLPFSSLFFSLGPHAGTSGRTWPKCTVAMQNKLTNGTMAGT